MAHVTTAMLRLLRPLGWQHLYIPLMHASMFPILAAVLRNHEPFFISTYREVSPLCSLSYLWLLLDIPFLRRSSRICCPAMCPRSPSLISSPVLSSTGSCSPREAALATSLWLTSRQVYFPSLLLPLTSVLTSLSLRTCHPWAQALLCRRLHALRAARDRPRVGSQPPAAPDRSTPHDGRSDRSLGLQAHPPCPLPPPHLLKTPRRTDSLGDSRAVSPSTVPVQEYTSIYLSPSFLAASPHLSPFA
jgi:hypothetical protein